MPEPDAPLLEDSAEFFRVAQSNIMGTCPYCHRSAGLFRSAHPECKQQHEQACQSLSLLLSTCFRDKLSFRDQDDKIKQICREGYIDHQTLGSICARALDDAISHFLNDGLISPEENDAVAAFIEYTGFPQSVLNINHCMERLVQSQILQDVYEGRKPKCRITTDARLPFLLARDETMLWLYGSVSCYQLETEVSHRGTESGFSIRLAKGLYYRFGGFESKPVETERLQPLGHGMVCLSDKAFYFSSSTKNLKLPYAQLITANAESRGVSLQAEGDGKPLLYFEGFDPWFCYNLIANLKP